MPLYGSCLACRYVDEVKLLGSLFERVYQGKRRAGKSVFVQLSHQDQKVSLESVGLLAAVYRDLVARHFGRGWTQIAGIAVDRRTLEALPVVIKVKKRHASWRGSSDSHLVEIGKFFRRSASQNG